MARLPIKRLNRPAASPYLGRPYPVNVDPHHRFPLTWTPEEGFTVSVTPSRDIKHLLKQWYNHRAHEMLPNRVDHFSRIMSLFPKTVRVRDTRSRWGSCSSKDAINFSWRIMALPISVIDYIVVHELAHLKERNHRPAFWNLVAAFMPDHKTHRAWLRKNTRSFLL